MYTPDFYLTIALAGLAAVAMLTMAGLSGWRGWLALKGRQLDHVQDGPAMMSTGAGARIEIADLKERIRKLEAIAAGVDL